MLTVFLKVASIFSMITLPAAAMILMQLYC